MAQHLEGCVNNSKSIALAIKLVDIEITTQRGELLGIWREF